MAVLERDSRRFGTVEGGIDYALLVDGLAAERDQGITIDVAYRYFETPRRRFILADAPGHQQYTRNMVTGASNSDLAIAAGRRAQGGAGPDPPARRDRLDARHPPGGAGGEQDGPGRLRPGGVRARSSPTSTPCSGQLRALAVTAIPVCARDGDNVTTPSTRMPWYQGTTLLAALESAEPGHARAARGRSACRCSWSARPDHTFRGYAGTVAAGTLRPGRRGGERRLAHRGPGRAHRHHGRRSGRWRAAGRRR